MKYILILLVSFAFSQMPLPIPVDNEAIEMERLFNEKGILTVESFYGMVKIPTLKSYEIYAEECYNDSTGFWAYEVIYQGELMYMGCDSTMNKMYVNYNKDCSKLWHHVTPTFEGFTEWLGDKNGN